MPWPRSISRPTKSSALGRARETRTLNNAALALGHLVGAGALSEAAVRGALEAAASSCGLAKDDGIRSVRATINSGLNRGTTEPTDLSKIGPRTRRAPDSRGRSKSAVDRDATYGVGAHPAPQGIDGEGIPPVGPTDRAGANSPSHPANPPADGAETFGPRPGGFDVEDMNREWSLVLMGSKAVVFRDQPDALLEDQQRMLSIEAFNAWFSNKFTEFAGPDGKIRHTTWAKAWLQHPDRRQYRGIEFCPDPKGAPGTPGYLNLWSGFAVQPAANPDWRQYSVFRDHLLNNICDGNLEWFKWVFGFFANIVQCPRDKPGVALVMRGRMGSGKSKVGEIIGALFPRHYFLVDDPRYVTGQFNSHMASCLLLQADEAVWAGDKAAEGRLKSLITSPVQMIEPKGIDPIRLDNYIRLIMTSNEDWVVPAGKDERRFTVLDVHPRCAQNHEYFREMDAQMAAGGLSHLLGDLLAFNLNSVNLRQILRTDALLEQKIHSLSSVDSWWYERLQSGVTTRYGSEWQREIPKNILFDDYIAVSEKIGVRRKQEETVFGTKLVNLLPKLAHARPTIEGKRVRCYVLPTLNEARESFEALVGQPICWDSAFDHE